MSTIDWLIVIIPVIAICVIGYRVRSHMKDVADFLAGGRVAGRYVLSVSSGESAIGLISVVGLFEYYYQTGVSLYFWQHLIEVTALIMALTGFAIYRYRETRALTMAQFFEVRYSRRFRIFSGMLAFLSGVVNYALFPAVGGRFLIYYCRLPHTFDVFGVTVSTFGFVMALFLSIALAIVLMGGQLTTMVTDCVQGLFGYVGFTIIVIALFAKFSFTQVGESLADQPPGESFLNPFDTGNFTQFNLLYVLIGVVSMVYNRMSWQGTQGFNAAASSPHEQKMAGLLGTFRGGFTYTTILLLGLAAYTYMHHPEYAEGQQAVQEELVNRIQFDDPTVTQTIRSQMTVPVALREILPVGITGVFVAMMIFLLVSTDTTYLHSWGSIFVQDVVMPLHKKPVTTKRQILYLRLAIFGIAVFAWTFSMYFGQVTYILMFFSLTGAIYMGGAGIVILGGLYSRRGTSQGAWTAMIVGASLGVFGFICQKFWSTHIYGWMSENAEDFLVAFTGMLESWGGALPFVNWEVTPTSFPISGQEMLFITMFCSTITYVVVSLLTCKEPFNLDRMLHRGEYNLEHKPLKTPKVKKGWIGRVVGIDDEYSRGDRWLAWGVFAFTLFKVGTFLLVVGWNLFIERWSIQGWLNYFHYFFIPFMVGLAGITSVWFLIGGSWDLSRLFRNLKNIQRNALDNGQVIGDQNAEDVAREDDSLRETLPGPTDD